MTSSSDDLETLARRVGDLEATLARVATDAADLAAVVAPVTNGDDGAEADAEVPKPAYRSLETWVDEYFTVVFARPVGGEIRWCSQWGEHPEALTRLEALWRAWETLRLDPNLGIATWLTNYLDPQLVALTSRAGTFAQCTPDRHAGTAALPTSAPTS